MQHLILCFWGVLVVLVSVYVHHICAIEIEIACNGIVFKCYAEIKTISK